MSSFIEGPLAAGDGRVERAALGEQLLHAVGGLGALRDPRSHLLVIDFEGRGLGAGVVVAQDLHETAVTRKVRLGDYYAVAGLLLLAHTGKSDFQQVAISSSSAVNFSTANLLMSHARAL